MKAFAFENIYLTSYYSFFNILLVIKHMQVQSVVEIIHFFMTIIYHLGSYTELVWTLLCQLYASLDPLNFS